MAAETGFPSFEDIQRGMDRLAERHPRIARVEVLGVSCEGREVRAVHVTDPDVPDADKQAAMVVCGRHGSELGTRAVGPAVLDWLTGDEAGPTRREQVVSVVPVANPDGCARGEFHAPSRHLSELERDTIARLAGRLMPDAVIDVHSFGAGCADLQALVTANTTGEAEDRAVYATAAAELVGAAAEAGWPLLLHAGGPARGYNNFLAGYCYESFHSLAFGLEVNHHVLRPDEAGHSGAAVIRALLGIGNRRAHWQPHDGYPVELLVGDFAASIRPIGATADDRRRSRATIWSKREFFRVGRREAPDRHSVVVRGGFSGYSGDAPSCGFALCVRVRGRHESMRVRLNGRPVAARTFHDRCSTFIHVEIRPAGPEDCELVIEP